MQWINDGGQEQKSSGGGAEEEVDSDGEQKGIIKFSQALFIIIVNRWQLNRIKSHTEHSNKGNETRDNNCPIWSTTLQYSLVDPGRAESSAK